MDTKIVNMVASARLTDTIDLHDVASTLDAAEVYEAEQFPGMVYRVGEATHGEGAPKVCLLLFGSGRVVATGAKSYEGEFTMIIGSTIKRLGGSSIAIAAMSAASILASARDRSPFSPNFSYHSIAV